ncbi:Membrane protein insertase YidC [Planctomycetes bacterium MalM25]|nr:Membrane protein insertase YidC [Planctomycetes bacterium MalM25]
MDIQQRRPQRGGEQPFDQRFLLFAMIALVAVMMLNRNPPPVDPNGGEADGKPLAAAEAEAQPIDAAAIEAATADLEETPAAAPERVAIGSVDPDSDYRMLLTIDNVGGAVERVELSSETYRDLEDRSGYLGRLALTDAPGGGALVNVVGPGTPAEAAGLQAGDVITAAPLKRTPEDELGDLVESAESFKEVLAATKPRRELALTIARGGESQSLTAKLRRQPLDLIRPELENVLRHTPEPPEGYESVPSFVVRLVSVNGRRDEDPAIATANTQLANEAWTVDAREAGSVALRMRLTDLGLEVVKRYTLATIPSEQRDHEEHPSYHFDLSVEVVNLLDQPQAVAYELTGPNGLPIEGYWYSNKIGRGDGSFFGDWGSFGLRDVIVRFADDRLTQFAAKSVADGDVDTMGGGQPLAFAGVDSQYFASIILPQKETLKEVRTAQVRAELATPKIEKPADPRWQNASCVLQRTPATLAAAGEAGATVSDGYRVFAGPKLPELLSNYTAADDANHTLHDILYYGWFAFAAKPMLWLLHTFYAIVGNYGLAIVLLTLCVRGAMFPISRQTALNMVKMQELKPELDRIVEKYGDDMQKRAAAQQELFRKHKYNPAAGCLPLFLQLPIFMGLYRALAVDVELRAQPLISDSIRFCSNLASPDMLIDWSAYTPLWVDNGQGLLGLGPYFNILPIASCALMLMQQKLFMPEATNDQARLQQSMMKYMMIFMGFIFFKMPSGLCIYFIVSTLWGIAERKMLPRPTPAPMSETTIDAGPKRPKPTADEIAQAKKKAAKKKGKKRK